MAEKVGVQGFKRFCHSFLGEEIFTFKNEKSQTHPRVQNTTLRITSPHSPSHPIMHLRTQQFAPTSHPVMRLRTQQCISHPENYLFLLAARFQNMRFFSKHLSCIQRFFPLTLYFSKAFNQREEELLQQIKMNWVTGPKINPLRSSKRAKVLYAASLE